LRKEQSKKRGKLGRGKKKRKARMGRERGETKEKDNKAFGKGERLKVTLLKTHGDQAEKRRNCCSWRRVLIQASHC